MKTDTPEARKLIYQKMLEYFQEAKEDNESMPAGFCWAISVIIGCYHENVHLIDYPELLQYKPKRKREDGFWFSPYSRQSLNKRIKILESILKEM